MVACAVSSAGAAIVSGCMLLIRGRQGEDQLLADNHHATNSALEICPLLPSSPAGQVLFGEHFNYYNGVRYGFS